MASLDDVFSQAVQHHTAGELGAAERLYRSILQVDPQHADALHLLGVIGYQAGHFQPALDLIAQARTLRPDAAPFHSNYGLVAQALQRYDDAVAAFQRAVELQPQTAEMQYNLANGLKGVNRLDDAVAAYRRAIQLKPEHAEAHNNLGNALRSLGQFNEAVAEFRLALQLKPDSAEFHSNLANALRDLGQVEESITSCRRALELQPNFVAALNNLGNGLKDQKRVDEAIACYRRTIELQPDFGEGYGNLGDALSDKGLLTEALDCYRRAIELSPDSSKMHSRLGNALMIEGRHAEGESHYRRALELDPAAADTHSSFLFWQSYRPGVTLAELAAEHAEWDRRHAQSSAILDHPRPAIAPPIASPTPSPTGRPLRVGFLSGDFGKHPVGYFAVRGLEHLDKTACEVVCYSVRSRNDEITARFRAAAHEWREAWLLSDDALAARIRDDHLDLLVDLAGHSAGNRLPVFTRKPAPVQVTWIGSEGTTGLASMDYLLADRCLVPPAAEQHYRETVLVMPGCYVCYEPPLDAPPVSPLPALSRGVVTFASFNNLAKLNPGVLDTWAKILRRVPGSRLSLKYRWLNDLRVQQQLADKFAVHGIERDRLEFSGWCSHAEMLARYNTVDIALDPFPFAGGATTCEALWMGLPVVTLPGETFASRHSLSYLTSAGMREFAARSIDDYINIAVNLATDLPRLSALRNSLRERLAASPLCDGKAFASELLQILRHAAQTPSLPRKSLTGR